MKRTLTQAQLNTIAANKARAYKRRRLTRAGYGPGAIVPYRRASSLVPVRFGGWTGRGLRIEKKYVDNIVAASPTDGVPTATLLNGIAQGDGPDQRNGRQITMKSIQLRLMISPTDGGTAIAGNVRIVLLLDRQPNSAAPTISDVFTGTNAMTLTNLDNRQRFQILGDMVYDVGGQINLTAAPVAGGGFPARNCVYYRKYGHTVTYNGTTNAIGSIASNSIYLICLSANSPSTGFQVQGYARVRFTDA